MFSLSPMLAALQSLYVMGPLSLYLRVDVLLLEQVPGTPPSAPQIAGIDMTAAPFNRFNVVTALPSQVINLPNADLTVGAPIWQREGTGFEVLPRGFGVAHFRALGTQPDGRESVGVAFEQAGTMTREAVFAAAPNSPFVVVRTWPTVAGSTGGVALLLRLL